VDSTDRDVLERFAGIVRKDIAPGHVFNRVRLIAKETGNHKAQYRWTTARRETVRRILAEFLPWFGSGGR